MAHPNRNTSYSGFHKALIGALLLLSASACNRSSDTTGTVLSACEKLKGFEVNKDSKAVIIVADNSCLECNREYATFLKKYLPNRKALFVISAHENRIDLSPYIDHPAENIIFDRNYSLTENGLIAGSTVLLLKEGKVDTMISAAATSLDAQLAYLSSRL